MSNTQLRDHNAGQFDLQQHGFELLQTNSSEQYADLQGVRTVTRACKIRLGAVGLGLVGILQLPDLVRMVLGGGQ